MVEITRSAYAEPGSSLNFKTGSWRTQRPTHRPRPAPCHHACPAGEDPQAWIAHAQQGHWRQAWEALVAANPLPAVTGRVCPHPCESACNRGLYDEPIAIHALERFLGDKAVAEDWPYPGFGGRVPSGKRVAVIGAGPSGLSAAYHLSRLGHDVTVFDEHNEAGGTLRTALPAFRLPRTVLDAESGRVLALPGINYQPRCRLGRDMTLEELGARFDSVFLGPGTQRSLAWDVDGATPAHLEYGLELLKTWVDVGALPTIKRAAVIGAGNTAVDAARVLKRGGVSEVYIVSHKAVPRPGVDEADAMPAILREVEEALLEGVTVLEHRGVRRLILRGAKVVGIELVRMKKLPQADGGEKRIAFEGTETVLEVDCVIPAVGQGVAPLGLEQVLTRGWLQVDAWGRVVGQTGLFAGGDALNHRGTVAAAIGDGHRSALAMEAALRSKVFQAPREASPIGIDELNLHYFEPAPRIAEPALPVAERGGEAEIILGLDLASAQAESHRCLSCGNCLACDNCWTLCPDSAVLKMADKASDGSYYVFDYDYCKGCGLCARECPCGYIQMNDEI